MILTSCGNKGPIDECYPNKGIKTARVSGRINSTNTSESTSLDNTQEIEFNQDGQPVVIRTTKEGETEHQRVYKDGKLQLIITTRKKLPDFYQIEELDSLVANATLETDTAIIVDHDLDGRPASIKNPDGITMVFEYEGCNRELITTLTPDGDTMQQVQNTKENGVSVEQIWTPFRPQKSSVITTYSGYKFDNNGHWIERTYKVRAGFVTERRELTYY